MRLGGHQEGDQGFLSLGPREQHFVTVEVGKSWTEGRELQKRSEEAQGVRERQHRLFAGIRKEKTLGNR